MQTYNRWPDPDIKYEGINQNEPARKRKHLRKYSILSIAWFWIRGLIAAVALCVFIGGAGNLIEFLARI